MVSYYQPRACPQDLMEYLQHLRYYGMVKEANTKLLLVAKYIDDPDKLQQFEDQWLYGTTNSNSPWNNWFFD